MKLLGQKTSDQVKSESARIIKEQKLNLKQAIHNNQEKNSGNSSTHVTRQLQMLEKEKEDKKLNEFKNYNQ
jgi:gas vesicle protein